MTESGNDIDFAKKLLSQGDIIAIPTETVYGLAGNAFDVNAVLKIFELKKRPTFNPLIVHTDSIEKINTFTTGIPDLFLPLIEKFWPGPLTILLPKANNIHPLVTGGSDLVAVRIPNHTLTLSLLSLLDFPLAAPSANMFGAISPTSALHVANAFGSKLSYILDGGLCSIGVESTILKLNEANTIEILRVGGIPVEDIEKEIGYTPIIKSSTDTPEAPGMLHSHYAPRTPLYINTDLSSTFYSKYSKIAHITFGNFNPIHNTFFLINLSPQGDLYEAAKNLFSAIHQADACGADCIVADNIPDSGLGKAVNDRLKRASLKGF